MMLMAIDHIRDYVALSAQQFLPTDLTRTTPESRNRRNSVFSIHAHVAHQRDPLRMTTKACIDQEIPPREIP